MMLGICQVTDKIIVLFIQLSKVSMCNYLHFTVRETEAQKEEVTWVTQQISCRDQLPPTPTPLVYAPGSTATHGAKPRSYLSAVANRSYRSRVIHSPRCPSQSPAWIITSKMAKAAPVALPCGMVAPFCLHGSRFLAQMLCGVYTEICKMPGVPCVERCWRYCKTVMKTAPQLAPKQDTN